MASLEAEALDADALDAAADEAAAEADSLEADADSDEAADEDAALDALEADALEPDALEALLLELPEHATMNSANNAANTVASNNLDTVVFFIVSHPLFNPKRNMKRCDPLHRFVMV